MRAGTSRFVLFPVDHFVQMGGGRDKGVSLTTIDVHIAAVALEHRASVFTLDTCFSRIARLTGLALYPLPAP
jgi:predicted nucleic acid-binding protein